MSLLTNASKSQLGAFPQRRRPQRKIFPLIKDFGIIPGSAQILIAWLLGCWVLYLKKKKKKTQNPLTYSGDIIKVSALVDRHRNYHNL